jgi:hypothetical protein
MSEMQNMTTVPTFSLGFGLMVINGKQLEAGRFGAELNHKGGYTVCTGCCL